MRRRLAALLAVLALAALPAGCGGDDADSADTGSTPATSTTPATATTPAGTTSTAPPSERDRLSSCLTKEGYRLQGGAPQVTDSEAPDYQIIFTGSRGGGYIGFYRNASRAKRVATQLRKNAKRTSGAAVERHGAINIVWIDLADRGARASVRACLVSS